MAKVNKVVELLNKKKKFLLLDRHKSIVFAKASHMSKPDVYKVGCMLLLDKGPQVKASVGMDLVEKDSKYLKLHNCNQYFPLL